MRSYRLESPRGVSQLLIYVPHLLGYAACPQSIVLKRFSARDDLAAVSPRYRAYGSFGDARSTTQTESIGVTPYVWVEEGLHR